MPNIEPFAGLPIKDAHLAGDRAGSDSRDWDWAIDCPKLSARGVGIVAVDIAVLVAKLSASAPVARATPLSDGSRDAIVCVLLEVLLPLLLILQPLLENETPLLPSIIRGSASSSSSWPLRPRPGAVPAVVAPSDLPVCANPWRRRGDFGITFSIRTALTGLLRGAAFK